MKFQIREGENTCDGSVIFRVYKSEDGETWIYTNAASTVERCKEFIERQRNPKAETLIEEIEV